MSYRLDDDLNRNSTIKAKIITIEKLRYFELSRKETNNEIITRLIKFAMKYKKHFDTFTMKNLNMNTQNMKGGQEIN